MENKKTTAKTLTKNMILSALFMAIGMILPFFTGQIPQIGSMLLPMHIPVFLCGLICGWQYGLIVGLVLPLFRSAVFGAPIMYPMAISMAFELMTYGFVAGFLYNKSKWQCIVSLYRSMIIAMICGRLVWGLVQCVLLSLDGIAFTLEAFLMASIIKAIPGIIVQLILIPVIMVTLNKTGLVKFKKHKKQKAEITK